jgi:hypothetical protein
MARRAGRMRCVVAAALVIVSGCGAAVAVAQQRPPLRRLGPAIATSGPLGALSAIRALPGGRVLVNDPATRRVLMLDSMLKLVSVVADTTSATQKAYGVNGGGLLAYRGDSTLFVDPASYSMLVIDPDGKVIRVIAAPRPQDAAALMGGARGGNAGFDAHGRLVYSNHINIVRTVPQPGQDPVPPQAVDSAPIVRFDLKTRKPDTVAFMKVQATRLVYVHTDAGMQISPVIDPVQTVDDWDLLPDGTIAILRADYHVDFIDADGRRRSGPRIPFDWQRLTDSAKIALIDSVRARGQRVPGRGAPGVASSAGRRAPAPVRVVAPSELPDYMPAFAAGAAHADPEGRLWVRTTSQDTTVQGPEYDVIDNTGKLVDRVAVPSGTTIIGFGAGEIVYLGVRDRAGVHLVRAREH